MNDNVPSTKQEQANVNAQANSLLSKVARTQLTEDQFLGEVFGSYIYRVHAGWEAEQVKSERNVSKVTSAMELREAMENPDVVTIFIPQVASLTMEMVEKILKQSSLDKTLFWEAA